MKLRVKYYNSGYWCIQRQWLGMFWFCVTRALVFQDSRIISNRYHPMLFKSSEEAEDEARNLLMTGAMDRHIEEQDRIWDAAYVGFKKLKQDRRKIKIIHS